VLEQIVGEIEDEFDIPEEEGDIFALADRTYRVSGDTPVERVSEAFGVQVVGSDADEAFDTIGGLIAHEMGHVPRRGEQLALCGLQFVVLHTKGGRCAGSRWRHCRPIRQRLPDDFPTVRASAAQALAGAVVGGCGWGASGRVARVAGQRPALVVVADGLVGRARLAPERFRRAGDAVHCWAVCLPWPGSRHLLVAVYVSMHTYGGLARLWPRLRCWRWQCFWAATMR
jgi:hypothetical protein